jgi:3D (Asp-Asp-Asp) domain-containing protein
MKRMTMRLALLAAAIVVGTLGFNTPLLLVKDSPDQGVAPAEASIARRALQPRPPRSTATRVGSSELIGGLGAVGAATAQQAVRATGHVIPADLPQPPIGRFKLTAYSGPQLGQPLPITATGTAARTGRTVAVDPRIIPLGSKIYIEGIGERIAEDVGGGIKGHHIDVYLGTVPQARDFGVRRGRVSLVAPSPKRAQRQAADDRG